ncbi:glycoside hydrolase family 172 protein [candidate division KSB1 bacterium]
MYRKNFLLYIILIVLTMHLSAQIKVGTSISQLADLEHLIYLQEGRCEQVSSYDRTGGNDDGFNGTYSYLRIEKNGEYVIMESDKPGAIVQIWFTNITTAGRIKFYFDGSNEPSVDMDIKEFFSGEVYPYVNPLTGDDDASSGGFVCYLPMPYRKSCKITTTGIARFYHIDYRIFDNDEGIKTFSLPLSDAEKTELDNVLQKCRNCEVVLGDVKELSGNVNIKSEKNSVLFGLDGPKIIKRIEFRIPGSSETVNLKRLVLRAYWDESENPGIEAPFIDFFGTGYGKTDFKSMVLGIDEGKFYCNFPMPFINNAAFKLENGNETDIELEYKVYYMDAPDLKDGEFVYFHAQWYQTRTEIMEPFKILYAKGKGHFTGVNMTMQGFNNIGFLEGDERIYVEGEALPIWVGTGTEDYFNGGWYFNRGTFALPYFGLSVKEPGRGRISVYRYHNLDAVPFKYNIYVGIEHGSKNNYPGAYYSCTAYWYQTLPYEKNVEFVSAVELTYPRSTLQRTEDLVDLKDKVDMENFSGQRISAAAWEELTEDWEGAEESVLTARRKNDYFKFNFNVEWGDVYSLRLYYGKGPDRGIFSVYVDDEKVLSDVNSYAETYSIFNESESFDVQLTEGNHTVAFVVEDKDDNSSGHNIGVDFLRINTGADFIQQWHIIGPFPAEEGKNFETAFPPETVIDLKAEYPGKGGKTAAWQKVKTKDDIIWFNEIFEEKEDGIGYGYCRVNSPDDREVLIYTGSDDGIKIFLNNEQVWSNPSYRGLRKDQDRVKVKLKKGWNDLLVKVAQGMGGWGYCIRISNYDGKIKYKAE